MGIIMEIKTKNFGEIVIDADKIITFPAGIIGFPEMTEFTLIHDLDKGAGSIHWLQSTQEPAFAMPVINPLAICSDYNPEVDDEVINGITNFEEEEILVLVTVSVPSDLTQMSANLQGPIIINVEAKKACQVIVEGSKYPVKYMIYDILKSKKKQKEGE